MVTGATDDEHLQNLEEVLTRLQQHGIQLKHEKCQFMKESVDYLGHHIDSQGVHASPNKVKAIVQAPSPKNVQELRSFLGMINYYGKFLAKLSTFLHPLNELLKTEVTWEWSEECECAFQEAKGQLSCAPVLAHYDPSLPIRLAGDASNYRVGAVLSQVTADGHEHPIAFASRMLTSAERNYGQVEKEALSLIFGICKFHKYVHGRHFTLVTDHQPLMAILGPKSGTPVLAAARLQRWGLLLSAYHYEIEFRPTKAHANANGLSRLPLPVEDSSRGSSVDSVFNITQVQALPVSFSKLRKSTCTDPVLSKVLLYVQ